MALRAACSRIIYKITNKPPTSSSIVPAASNRPQSVRIWPWFCLFKEIATPFCSEQKTCVLCSCVCSTNDRFAFGFLGPVKKSFLDYRECKWGWGFAATARFHWAGVFAREEFRFKLPPLAAGILSLSLAPSPSPSSLSFPLSLLSISIQN